MDNEAKASPKVIPPIPRGLLLGIYVLYCGLPTTASVPLFADIDWLHEGERLGPAQIVLNGGLPFRGAYLTHGLSEDILRPLLGFWVFGESIASERIIGALTEPLAYVGAAFYIWRVFPTSFWRIIGLVGFALYPLLLVPRHIMVFFAMGLLTSWVYQRERRGLLFGAGLLTGLSYVLSTFDHATFLLGTVLVFPLAMAVMDGWAGREGLATATSYVAGTLWGGVLVGLVPFAGFLSLSGTTGSFLHDLATRILADTVARRDPYLPLTLMNVTWYLIPSFYLAVAGFMTVRVAYWKDFRWAPIAPTLIFGLLSFIYAAKGCCPTYGKLATVSFPFIVVFIYIQYLIGTKGGDPAEWLEKPRMSEASLWLLGVTGILSGSVLVTSLLRDWNDKQVAPRILFPVVTIACLATVGMIIAGRIHSRRWCQSLTVICSLMALVASAWFYNDAKPQVLAALMKKPLLMSDLHRLAGFLAENHGRLTRDQPPYLQDEALSYLSASSHRGQAVVMLSTGAGVYYFLASASPPNRFPEVYHAMADRSATEVIQGMKRTHAELLVACNDHGQSVTGWPMNPLLRGYIAANYVDSGRRLNSKLLGQGCPFSVWVHREATRGIGA